MTTRVRCLFCGQFYGYLGRTKHMHKRQIYYVLKGRKDRTPYHTQQSLRIGAVVSKLGRVTGWGWEGNNFVVHIG